MFQNHLYFFHMKSFRFILSLVVLLTISCSKNEPSHEVEPEKADQLKFSVDNNYLLKNNVRFDVKGVVYVPGYPGYLPWEIETSTSLPSNLKSSIYTDISNIKRMGANTIRFWGAPKYCYEALKSIGGLYFIQTIWIKGDEPDFQNSTFKETTKEYIRQVVDRVYSVF
jgi:hypothetical protein